MRPREYSSEQRNLVVQFILECCIKGEPPRGTLKKAQLKFSISRQTSTRYWNAAKKQQESGKAIQLVSGKKSRQYSKVIHFDLTLFQGLNFSKICNIRSIAIRLGCSKSTVWRWVKAGLIKSHTSAIRPDLTAPNKLLRLRRVAQLPHNLEVPKELAIECISYLKDQGCIDGLEMIARTLGMEV
ncbi:hypothetical protein SASPL_102548 [Salvia splendens]|uniref:Uncharacterized protein n=1 Tax=Salvia splendens TaxID=180675 RepID=A0A8X9AC90_SALSN|nr:hypothetical protein SASPL_102548 [Salvia splendens]